MLFWLHHSNAPHAQTSEAFSLSKWGLGPQAEALPVSPLTLPWPQPLAWYCRSVWSWPYHCVASAAGSSWEVAKFHWHGAWRSAHKSCTHGHGSCKRGGGMWELVVAPWTSSRQFSHEWNQTHANKFVYNYFMRYSQCAVSKAEIKWNEQFPDETLQWKNIYQTVFKSTNDIKLRNLQYKYIMHIVPTNQFLTKCNIVGSALWEFCNMEIASVWHLFWECAHVQQFWTSVSVLLRVCDSYINITVKTITFGQNQWQCTKTRTDNYSLLSLLRIPRDWTKYVQLSVVLGNPIMTYGYHFGRNKSLSTCPLIDRTAGWIDPRSIDITRNWNNKKKERI